MDFVLVWLMAPEAESPGWSPDKDSELHQMWQKTERQAGCVEDTDNKRRPCLVASWFCENNPPPVTRAFIAPGDVITTPAVKSECELWKGEAVVTA